jgi:hypothetical protein
MSSRSFRSSAALSVLDSTGIRARQQTVLAERLAPLRLAVFAARRAEPIHQPQSRWVRAWSIPGAEMARGSGPVSSCAWCAVCRKL